MKLINANDVYYDNDFGKWYFAIDEDFENAQVVDDNYAKENKQLKQQLSEKDKVIESLNRRVNNFENIFRGRSRATKRTGDVYKDFVLEIRKQVCDEIREQININCRWDELGHIVDLYWHDLNNILDQIEKENAMKDEELAIRERFAEEVYQFIMDNWEDVMGRQGRWQNFSGTCIDLKNDLEKIAENGYAKGE